MTTIVTDGTFVAWESQLTIGNQRALYPRHKVEFHHGMLIGLAGATPSTSVMVKWFEAGCPKEGVPPSDFEMIVFKRDGTILYIDNSGPFPQDINAPHAIGSGSTFALGAMAFGADAAQACAAACLLDINSGGPVYVLDIKKALRSRGKDARLPTEYEVDDLLKGIEVKR